MAEISKTADQALTVLLKVAEDGPMTLADLSRTLEMNRTVLHRLLATLHERGFVARQPDGYVPGAILVRIAGNVQPELRTVGRSAMRSLARATHETVALFTADGPDAVVLEQAVPAGNVVRVELEIGARSPLHLGAGGRALLAFLDPRSAERAWRRVEDAAALQRELETVRHRGYALAHDELQQGVHGLAVPVHDADSRAVAAMTVLVPATRADGLAEHLEALQQTVTALSRTLSAQR